jgi:hypothetical protein
MVVLSIAAVGCATPRPAQLQVAHAEPTQASEELECMGECLDQSDTSCDECAMRCFQTPASTGTVTFAR